MQVNIRFIKKISIYMEIELDSTKANHHLDNYTMLTVIGKGGYAKVVLVKKNDNGEIYAMKILKKKFIGNFFNSRVKEINRTYHHRKKRFGFNLTSFHM